MLDQILDGLFKLFFTSESVTGDARRPVFMIGCAIIGILAVVADFSFFIIRGGSLLQLRYNFKNSFIFIAWPIGAAIIGFFGQIIDIFQISMQACATIGLSWPVVFAKILKKIEEKEETQTPSNEVKHGII